MSVSLYEHSWLDAHALADATFGAAYESLGDEGRAVLKKCLARLYDTWGELPGRSRSARELRQGFSMQEEERPVPYALLVCPCGYPWPASFAAALMPPLLAGVETILPVFIPQAPERDTPSAALLGVLELAGVERAYLASAAALLDFVRELQKDLGQGRLVVLRAEQALEPLFLHVCHTSLPMHILPVPPVFKNHEGTRLEPVFAGPPAPAGNGSLPPSLTLDQAHEQIWFWPELAPSWFRARSVSFSAIL